MFSSITNQGNAKLSKDHTSAYYVAESGMNITIEAIKEYLVDNNFVKFLPSDNLTAKKAELKAYLTNASNWPPVILSGLNPTGMFSVLITESEDQFTVRVTGTVNNVSRTIQSTFDYDTILHPLAKAVFAQGKIEIQGNGQIIGPIASMMIPSGVVKNPTEINLKEEIGRASCRERV